MRMIAASLYERGKSSFDPFPLGMQGLVAFSLGFLLSVPILFLLFLYVLPLSHNKSKRVAVLVLGDIGRSPRMQNHAVSLAKAGWDVDLVGFKGKSLPQKILMIGAELFADVLELKEQIVIRYLPSPPKLLTRGGIALFLILGPLKVIFQIFSMFIFLLRLPQPSCILVQVVDWILELTEEPTGHPNFCHCTIGLQFPFSKTYH